MNKSKIKVLLAALGALVLGVILLPQIPHARRSLHTGNFPRDFLWEVRQGKIPGHKMVFLFGRNDAVPTSYATVFSAGGLKRWVDSPVSMDLSSTDPDDTVGGTGCREVFITYINEDGDEDSLTAPMGGAVRVSSTTMSTPLTMTCTKTGISGWNEGIISIRDGADVYAQIGTQTLGGVFAGDNLSNGAFYKVPEDHRGYVISILGSVEATKSVKTKLMVRPPGLPWLNTGYIDQFQVATPFPIIGTTGLVGGTEIELQSAAKVGTAEVTMSVEIMLVKDN